MPELGSYGSVRGARGNSRPYRERGWPTVRTALMTISEIAVHFQTGQQDAPETSRTCAPFDLASAVIPMTKLKSAAVHVDRGG